MFSSKQKQHIDEFVELLNWLIYWTADKLFLHCFSKVNSKGRFYQNFDSLILKCSLSSMQSIQKGRNQPIYWAGLESQGWINY